MISLRYVTPNSHTYKDIHNSCKLKYGELMYSVLLLKLTLEFPAMFNTTYRSLL